MEPAVLVDGLGGGLRVLVVAQHDDITADADLTGLVQLDLAEAVRLAQSAQMLALLRNVQQAIAGQLGHGVALIDVEAVGDEVAQDLRVEDGGRAAQVPQAVQLVLIAAADLVVDHLHQHRRGGHGVAVHHGHIAAHVARVRAEVQGPAMDAVGEVADEAGQVEHGHQREVAEGLVHILRGQFLGLPHNGRLASNIHPHGTEVVLLA